MYCTFLGKKKQHKDIEYKNKFFNFISIKNIFFRSKYNTI